MGLEARMRKLLLCGLILALSGAILLTTAACGGGGSGSDEPSGPAQWDGATWDGATWED